MSQLSPAEIEEERRRAEAFNVFLDAFPAPPPQPVAPSPAPVSSTWKPRLPTVTPGSRGAETLAAKPPDQEEADASAGAPEPGADKAPRRRRGSCRWELSATPSTVCGDNYRAQPSTTTSSNSSKWADTSQFTDLNCQASKERAAMCLNTTRSERGTLSSLIMGTCITSRPAAYISRSLPPMQPHPLPATVTPKYKPPPVCFDRPRPAADQPELGLHRLHPPAPRPARSTFEDPPPPPPRPVPTEPSVKQGPPPKTPRRGSREATHTRRFSGRFRKASGTRRPQRLNRPLHDVRRCTTYSLDRAHPGPIAKPAAVDPWLLPAGARKPEGLAPAKPAPPPAMVKPCAYQDYRKTTLTAGPKAATPPGYPKSAADRPGPRRTGPSTTQPQARRWVPGKGSARPPAPPIPEPGTGKAAPAPDPKAGLEPSAPAPVTEAEHEPSDPAAQTRTEEPEDSQ